jgi:exopolyphosphatase/guanosine-5'-triphosphate,3'-diphosphate pyrophosphatase
VHPDIYEAMVAEVARQASAFEAQAGLAPLVAEEAVQLLGTSGTVTTLTGVYLRLPRYDRARVDGYHMEMETVRRISRAILEMSFEDRKSHGCIGPERADLVIAGCAILEGLCRVWPVPRLRVADRGLREGILRLMMVEAGVWRLPQEPLTGAAS